jgi:hypothetical protein
MQAPFTQVWPVAQAWLQLPQFAVLVVTSMQPAVHSIWPATAQPHVPALQTEPDGQTMLQEPQLSGSFGFVRQVPLGHIMTPGSQLEAQCPALQTWPSWQTVLQSPQWLLSEPTQAPLQLSNPAWHWQEPFWHI